VQFTLTVPAAFPAEPDEDSTDEQDAIEGEDECEFRVIVTFDDGSVQILEGGLEYAAGEEDDEHGSDRDVTRTSRRTRTQMRCVRRRCSPPPRRESDPLYHVLRVANASGHPQHAPSHRCSARLPVRLESGLVAAAAPRDRTLLRTTHAKHRRPPAD
jgi:hypothetical protein